MKLALPLASLLLALIPCGLALAQDSHGELKPIAFSTLDTNKDGKISRAEAHAAPDLYASFDMLDLNHDGFLSRQEFQAWPRAAKSKVSLDPTTVPGGSAGAQHMPAN